MATARGPRQQVRRARCLRSIFQPARPSRDGALAGDLSTAPGFSASPRLDWKRRWVNHRWVAAFVRHDPDPDIRAPFPASHFRPFVHLVGRQLLSATISRLYDLSWWSADWRLLGARGAVAAVPEAVLYETSAYASVAACIGFMHRGNARILPFLVW
jgi:hypothetical protein